MQNIALTGHFIIHPNIASENSLAIITAPLSPLVPIVIRGQGGQKGVAGVNVLD
jgi:hypothetical protein